MISYSINRILAKKWFPNTYQKFLKDLRYSKSTYSNTEEDKLYWTIIWGFYTKTPISEIEIEKNEKECNKRLKLTYEKRCEYDIKHIKIQLNLNTFFYSRTDIITEKIIPSFLLKFIKHTIIHDIYNEQILLQNTNVIRSLDKYKNINCVHNYEEYDSHVLEDLTDEEMEDFESFNKPDINLYDEDYDLDTLFEDYADELYDESDDLLSSILSGNINFVEDDDDDDDYDDERYINQPIVPTLNIDTILEKINEHGKESLTQSELNFLKNNKL